MPTIRQIFGHSVPVEDGKYLVVRDRKPKQCSFIENIEEPPFIKRCILSPNPNSKLCDKHENLGG